ncbi:hypothetical protein HF883_10285 [Cloacibacillus porcorum]|uniref:hypothetical protein n=1 Tax=Cloacibacillus porcorum TaxID=1197717 RepID=UPI001459F162|nr:hypothetical protein [Cloacibacillus porcorum]NMF18607.1 hypothetical protein [Cloacibacillus porcorum]
MTNPTEALEYYRDKTQAEHEKQKVEDVALVGERYGKLIIESFSHRDKRGKTYVLCLCDCGNRKVIRLDHLKSGLIQSCSCIRRERAIAQLTTHGLLRKYPQLYSIWSGMKQRCNNPKCREYRWYGARGISICSEWLTNFKAFVTWAVAQGYIANQNLSIDRIDPDKDYMPSNCRWLPRALNSALKRPRGKQNEYCAQV